MRLISEDQLKEHKHIITFALNTVVTHFKNLLTLWIFTCTCTVNAATHTGMFHIITSVYPCMNAKPGTVSDPWHNRHNCVSPTLLILLRPAALMATAINVVFPRVVWTLAGSICKSSFTTLMEFVVHATWWSAVDFAIDPPFYIYAGFWRDGDHSRSLKSTFEFARRGSKMAWSSVACYEYVCCEIWAW